MSESQALEKLRDIHLPEPISWWPMAFGWYLLGLAFLVFIILVFYFIRRFYVNGKAKREALDLLKKLEQEYKEGRDSQLSSMRVSELLRRVALVYFPREEVASLKGEPWLAFLSKTSKGIDFKTLDDYLLILPYQRAKETDLEPLFSSAKKWIKQRGKPCSN